MAHVSRLLAFGLLLLTGVANAETVKSVYDGDTFTLSTGEKIRLACIDTPEMKNTAKKKADKPAAIAARDYLKSLIGTSDLTIDRVQTDLYGRTIARVYTPDGRELSREMFNSGHAVIFNGYSKPCPWTQQ
jgi:endonuclease YncB( thermonuclease family)